VQKLIAILLASCFAVLGTGAVEHAHNAHHAAEDALALEQLATSGRPAVPLPGHDESNCVFHLQLHLPALPIAIAPPTVNIARLVGQAVVAIPSLTAQLPLLRIDCRGPPLGQ
jgi:hypothetical protein